MATPDSGFLYRYRPNLDRAEDELAGKLWAARPDTLNDPCEEFFISRPTGDQKGLVAILRGTTLDQGVVCFSEDPKDECMWAYYGNQMGYCIEYDASCPVVSRAIVVKYPPGLSTARSHKEALEYKTPPWEHEQEWRIVVPNSEKQPGVIIPGATISGLIVGRKTPWSTQEFLKAWALSNRLRYGQVHVDRDAMCLKLVWECKAC